MYVSYYKVLYKSYTSLRYFFIFEPNYLEKTQERHLAPVENKHIA